jgi:biotin-[acetyl-CoA-carboxylase] ligase BirA-like protein
MTVLGEALFLDREGQRSAGGERSVHRGRRLAPSDRPAHALQFAGQLQLVARFDDPLEPDAVDPGEERELALVLLIREHRNRPRLRHRLDDQDPGHDRPAGKVTREVPLVRPHLFTGNHLLPWAQVDDLVEEQERVAVRQDRLELLATEGGHVRDESSDGGVGRDSLLPEHVEPLLHGRFGRPYRYLERCESTQRELPADAPEGAVVAAGEQTAGRGRLGRRWLAAPGTSLLFSVNLRPPVETQRLPALTILAGAAAADGVGRATGLLPEIKLPNDLLVHGRKLAGILAEAREDRVVLGMGINVNVATEDLPAGVDRTSTSLLVELGEPVDRARLLAAILLELERQYDAWISAGGAGARR